jgi:hypothetical protein
MHIYIDESGSFVTPAAMKPKVSCVAALVVPSSKHDQLLRDFIRVRSSWGLATDEVKGSSLGESRIAEVISLLENYDVIVEICGIDVGSHAQSQVTTYKHLQADKLTESLTPQHQPTMIEDVHRRRDYLLKMPNQLFIQASCVIQLIDRVVETATLYYSQRIPRELGEFHWIVDAKDITITKAEEWWSLMMLPIIEAMSIKNPMMTLEGADYSYFKRFSKTPDRVPEHHKDIIDNADAPFEASDLKMIMQESFKFADSRTNEGLQLVDIVASAFTRAMNGNLKKEGWEKLGELIIGRKPQSIRMIMLNTSPPDKTKVIVQRNFHGYVIEKIEENAKPMLV